MKKTIFIVLSIVLSVVVSISADAQTLFIASEAGNNLTGETGNGGQALAAKVNGVFGLAVDKKGNLYFSEKDSNNVRRVAPNGIITKFAGVGGNSGALPYGGDGGPATAARLNGPLGVACDTFGNVYIADASNNVVRKVDTNGIITTVVGNHDFGNYPVSGPATSVAITANNLTFDRYNNMYICGRYIIYKVDTAWNLTTVGGSHAWSYSGVVGNGHHADSAEFGLLTGIAVDTFGNIFVVDPGSQDVAADVTNVIRKIDINGIVWPFAGVPGGSTFGGDGGPATAATFAFKYPVGITTDISGNVIVADQASQRIRKISAVTGYVSTIAGTGTLGYFGDHGAPTSAKLHGPSNTYYDKWGNLFISDMNNFLVREILPGDTLTITSDHGGSNLTDTVCGSSPVTFTAHIRNGGYGDTVCWYKNATKVAGNTLTYTAPTLSNGDSITCKLYAPGAGTVVLNSLNYIKIVLSPTPMPITGFPQVCQGSNLTLSEAATGGTWITNDSTIATVSTTGVVHAIKAGIDTIQYSEGAAACNAITVVTISPTPAPLAGPSVVCLGHPTTLTDSITGGTWTSSNNTHATVSSSGAVTGIVSSTVYITYSLPFGCLATKLLTVTTTPAAISGSAAVCMFASITLTDAVSGGTWSTVNDSLATVSPAGVVTGHQSGIDTIVYSHFGCTVSKPVTVNLAPQPIASGLSACNGSTSTITDTPYSGTWSGGSSSIATITGAGIVTAVSVGTVNIAYTLTDGCSQTAVLTVHPVPAAIQGQHTVCAGLQTTLTDSLTGGYWTVQNSSINAIDSFSGILTGLVAGTDTVTYTSAGGCSITTSVTVNVSPSRISGIASDTTQICRYASKFLRDSVAGGTWWSANSAVLSISDSGYITGITDDTTTVTYTLPDGCFATLTVLVDSVPLPIIGPASVCTGVPATYSDLGGGIWTNLAGFATIDSISGVITEVTTGMDTLIYTFANHCFATIAVSINASPAPVTGPTVVCAGAEISLSDTTAGGTWSVSDTVHAAIATTGVLTGLLADTVTAKYTLPDGCASSAAVVVAPVPSAISGTFSVCVGETGTLSDSVTDGKWLASNPRIVIDTFSGIFTVANVGWDTVHYTLPLGCGVMAIVSGKQAPTSISGVFAVCKDATTSLTDGIAGGGWLTSDSSVATISSLGVATGISAGTVSVQYTLPDGCSTSRTLTVNGIPSSITGISAVCTGTSATYTDSTVSGRWSVAHGHAAVDSLSGVLSGISGGLDTVVYRLSTGCKSVFPVTINTSPSGIFGASSLCVGDTAVYSNSVSGGAWSSSSTSVASIDMMGVLHTSVSGTTAITYNLSNGCSRHLNLTVNENPTPILGSPVVCIGVTDSLYDTTAIGMGEWISVNINVASVDILGNVTGVQPGMDTIMYYLPTGCHTAYTVTVAPLPSAIMGDTVFCAGTSVVLTDSTAGGRWFSVNTALAAIDSVSGTVHSFAGGIDTFGYRLPTGCSQFFGVTVNPAPGVISGINVLCKGMVMTLADTAAGGIWHSSDTSVAQITSSGVVSGVGVGAAVVSYVSPVSGCFDSVNLTVSGNPGPIAGANSVCRGATTVLQDTVLNGYWKTIGGHLTIDSLTGTAYGVDTGTDTVWYILYSGCSVSKLMSVWQSPSVITGDSVICVGSTGVLHDSDNTGGWSSWSASVATISNGSDFGTIHAVGAGVTTLMYILGNNCSVEKQITVNPTPGPITGATDIAFGKTATLGCGVSGGVWTSVNTSLATVSATGIVTPLLPGLDTVIYTLPNGCASSTILNIQAGTNGVNLNPNPVIDEITLIYKVSTNATFEVIDVSGRKLVSVILFAVNNKIVIPCSNWARALYQYRVVQGNNIIATGKFEKL
jgi:trimeric autotransporter adhesin